MIAAEIGFLPNVQFVVENRTGGNGTVAGLDVHRAAPDGYTVLFHAPTHNVAQLVMRDATLHENPFYDPQIVSAAAAGIKRSDHFIHQSKTIRASV